MKFKDFQAPVLFSSTFKALNLVEKMQVLSRMHGNPVYNIECKKFVKHHNTESAISADETLTVSGQMLV